MHFLDRFLLVMAVIFAFMAHMNAKEAHRHAHEIGCAVGYEPLCIFHKADQ